MTAKIIATLPKEARLEMSRDTSVVPCTDLDGRGVQTPPFHWPSLLWAEPYDHGDNCSLSDVLYYIWMRLTSDCDLDIS